MISCHWRANSFDNIKKKEIGLIVILFYRCPTCGSTRYQPTNTGHVTIQNELRAMEDRLSQQMGSQIENLRRHFDSRINQMFSAMVAGGGFGGKSMPD